MLINYLKFLLGLCLLWLFLIACGEARPKDSELIHRNKEQASVIVEAIEKYQTEKGQLPPNLEALEPNYISQVPLTTEHEQYGYVIRSRDGYVLTFYLSSQSYCSYLYNSDFWDCGFYENH